MIRVLAALTVAVCLVLSGCKSATKSVRDAAADRPPVQIKAYINVSSGCQAATVELLQQLAKDNPGRIQLELVDFGDGGEGARRWQESGYTCMTIEINGSPNVQYPSADGPKTTTFQMPAGFLWTHEELQAAVAAALEGKVKAVTADEAMASQPAQQVTVKWSAREVSDAGQTLALLTADGRPVLKLSAAVPGKSALQRAQAAAQALQQWTAKPVKLSDLVSREAGGQWEIVAGDKVLLATTADEADAMKLTPQKLADAWLGALRHALLGPGQQSPAS